MGYIVIDTCVWIELAGKPPLQPLLAELGKYASPPPHQLVVTDSVQTEFGRHRDQTRVAWTKSLEGHVRGLNYVRQAVDGVAGEIARIEEAARKAVSAGGVIVRQNLDDVDRLFAAAKPWTPGPSHHKDACDRCIDVRPPALKTNRSSVGDCLLWSAVVDLLDSGCVWFCSGNKNDFSDAKRQDVLHANLLEEVKAKRHKLHFYIDPTLMLEALREQQAQKAPASEKPAPVVKLPHYFDYAPTPPSACPRCAGTNFNSGAYLRSQYGGLTFQFVCLSCGYHHDTGDFWD